MVLEKFCDTLTRPDETEDCFEPCPGHCVVSSWSGWTECEQVSGLMRCLMTDNVEIMRPGPGLFMVNKYGLNSNYSPRVPPRL